MAAAAAAALSSGPYHLSYPSCYITDSIRVQLARFVQPDHYLSIDEILEQLKTYSEEEKAQIFADFESVFESTFKGDISKGFFIVTAGGGGAGKTTLLENFLKGHPGYVYVDPDQTCLPKMKGYVEDCRTKGCLEAYNKWRYGSTFIALALIAYAFKEGYSLAYGSTMTSSSTAKKVLSTASKVFASVTLHYIAASDEVRRLSVKKRESFGAFPIPESDFRDKGRAFFDRLPDYIASGATIEFYYRASMDETKLAAKREKAALVIVDEDSWKAIRALHNSVKGAMDFEHTLGL